MQRLSIHNWELLAAAAASLALLTWFIPSAAANPLDFRRRRTACPAPPCSAQAARRACSVCRWGGGSRRPRRGPGRAPAQLQLQPLPAALPVCMRRPPPAFRGAAERRNRRQRPTPRPPPPPPRPTGPPGHRRAQPPEQAGAGPGPGAQALGAARPQPDARRPARAAAHAAPDAEGQPHRRRRRVTHQDEEPAGGAAGGPHAAGRCSHSCFLRHTQAAVADHYTPGRGGWCRERRGCRR